MTQISHQPFPQPSCGLGHHNGEIDAEPPQRCEASHGGRLRHEEHQTGTKTGSIRFRSVLVCLLQRFE